MAFLALAVVRHLVFAPVAPGQIDSYIAGLILLAAAPCTAMVFVWSKLTDGDPYFTLSQVALNDAIMIFAFAPIVGLLLGISSIMCRGMRCLTRSSLYHDSSILAGYCGAKFSEQREAAHPLMQPWTGFARGVDPGALLLTLVLLFAFQGEAIPKQLFCLPLLRCFLRPQASG